MSCRLSAPGSSLLNPQTAMNALTVSGKDLSLMKEFDRIVDDRAEKREHLRGRNNVTSCRSPTRNFDTLQVTIEMKNKRHLEFQRRRSVSPDQSANCSPKKKPKTKTLSMKHYLSTSKSETLHRNMQNIPTLNGHPLTVLASNNSKTDGPSSSNWASLWSQEDSQEADNVKKQPSTSIPTAKESNLQRTKTMVINKNNTHVQKTSTKMFTQTEKSHQSFSDLNKTIIKKISLRENSMQTESGFVTVKESDIKLLADLLQEALWREEVLRKKLATLQEGTSNLMNSSNKTWTTRCNEDLLRNKIKALEAQLQVCRQKFSKDGVRKVVIQMEKQKRIYEEKALEALQRATEEKMEALSMAESVQEALSTAKTESMKWQGLYEELKGSHEQLWESQRVSTEQIQELHSQLELSGARETELQDHVVSLSQEMKEMQKNIFLLEEDKQMFREEIQQFTDGSDETQDLMVQEQLTSEGGGEPQMTERRVTQLEEELCQTQEKLRLKEKECEELQIELCAMEQECQSSQVRLSQCRDELRQLSQRRKPTVCGSWWKVWVVFLLFLAVAQVAMLWLWHPPFREKVEDLYSDIETRVENYLMEMASPRYSSCFRPI